MSFKSIRKALSKDKLAGLFYTLPCWSWLFLFFLIPIVWILAYSFMEIDPLKLLIIKFPIFDYYGKFFSTSFYVQTLLKSIGVAAAITLGSVVLAYSAAYYISFKVKGKKFFILFIFWAPFLASYILILLAWRVILGSYGVLNSLLMYLGIISEPITAFLYNIWAVIFVLIHIYTPWITLPIYVSLEKIDRTLLEASLDLGATPFQTFRKITFPLSLPGVLVAIMFVFIPSTGIYVTSTIIGGPEGIMFGNIIESLFIRGVMWSMGSACTVVLLIIVIISLGILLRKAGFDKVMESL